MFRAMAIKELREVRGIALLALAAYVVVIWIQANSLLKWHPDTLPFVTDGFLVGFIFVSGALAAALGLRQTLGESIIGAYPFLLHRPATCRWLIGMKLLVGLAAYLVCGWAAILVYGAMAAMPGVHASPFVWAMTTPAWVAWAVISVVYLGAFLSGIRPGRWFFSRLFPLAGAALAAYLLTMSYDNFAHGTAVSLTAVVLVDVYLTTVILFVANTRDYS